jgi:hypothetical protein
MKKPPQNASNSSNNNQEIQEKPNSQDHAMAAAILADLPYVVSNPPKIKKRDKFQSKPLDPAANAQLAAAASASETLKPITHTSPVAPAPVAQVPVAQVPVAQVPVAQVPVAQVPVAQVPVAQVPVAQVPVAQVPVAQVPVAQVAR